MSALSLRLPSALARWRQNDEQATNISAEQSVWDAQMETLRYQAQYADEMRQAMDAATAAGLRTMHACGMYRYTGALKGATGQEVLEWWRNQ